MAVRKKLTTRMYFIHECEAKEKEKEGKGNINTWCTINDARETSERCTTMFIQRELWTSYCPWQMIIESISAALEANDERHIHKRTNEIIKKYNYYKI